MENSRPPEKNNGTNPRRHLAREFGSRFKSHFLSASSAARHSPSQNVRQPETISLEKKALSADRTQPKTPSRCHVSESDISQALPDHALRPSTNVVQKQIDDTLRKPAAETKRNPPKGDNSADETENSRPVNGLNSQLLDHHALPSTTNKGIHLSERKVEMLMHPSPLSGSEALSYEDCLWMQLLNRRKNLPMTSYYHNHLVRVRSLDLVPCHQ